MITKSSFTMYRYWKTHKGGDGWIYDNTPAPIMLFQASANTLQLSDRNKFRNEERCPPCEDGTKDLEHFILKFKKYMEERN